MLEKNSQDLEVQKWKKKEVGVKPGDQKDWWWVEIHIGTPPPPPDSQIKKPRKGRREKKSAKGVGDFI